MMMIMKIVVMMIIWDDGEGCNNVNDVDDSNGGDYNGMDKQIWATDCVGYSYHDEDENDENMMSLMKMTMMIMMIMMVTW